MPQRNIYHNAVKVALVKDGWTVTHDPYTLPFGLHNLYVDIGAERMLAAEKGADKIAVEIKSFVSRSEVEDIEQALGQYLLYRSLLQRQEPDRTLYLAVPQDAWVGVFRSDLGRVIREDYSIRLVIFEPQEEVLRQWVK